MLPDLVTVEVPAPTINTVSVVESLPVKRTPAVPFDDPVPVKSYVVSVVDTDAQVLSPRKNVELDGVPVADNSTVNIGSLFVPDKVELTKVPEATLESVILKYPLLS